MTTNLARNVVYYGDSAPLNDLRMLTAGKLMAALEGGDLRYIRWGEHEILRRLYVAIRDHNWGTIPPQYSNWQLEVQPDSFLIAFDVVNQHADIDFFWHGEIRGDADSRITYTMHGIARSTFLRNRIGFCVLQPAATAGKVVHLEHVDGSTEDARLPVLVSSDQPVLPFSELRSITAELAPGVMAKVAFAGEVFEMEDQRNWTDASFKIFGTPITLPYPVRVEQGTPVRQQVTISLDAPMNQSVTGASGNNAVTLTLGSAVKPLPELGLGMASHGQALTAAEIERLKHLQLAHLRAQIQLEATDWRATLERATAEANALDLPLEIALPLQDDSGAALTALRTALDELRPRVKRWLITPQPERQKGGAPFAVLLGQARAHLQSYDPEALFAGGTDTDFIFLARNMAGLEAADALCFALHPQAHATDHRSVVETLAAQVAPVGSAVALANGRPVFVSPITFKPRSNPYATGSALPVPKGELPPHVDPRQLSLFGAGWTVGSYKYVTEAGAAGVTFFETTGWRGVMETVEGAALPEKFPSQPTMLYPIYHVLRAVGELRGGKARQVTSGDPLRVEALALQRGGQTRLLLCNFSETAQQVQLQGLDVSNAQVIRLNEHTIERAVTKADGFVSSEKQPLTVNGGSAVIELLPFEIVQLDLFATD